MDRHKEKQAPICSQNDHGCACARGLVTYVPDVPLVHNDGAVRRVNFAGDEEVISPCRPLCLQDPLFPREGNLLEQDNVPLHALTGVFKQCIQAGRTEPLHIMGQNDEFAARGTGTPDS